MEKMKMNGYYPVILICLVILVIAGSVLTYGILFPSMDHPSVNSPSEGDNLNKDQKVIDTNFGIQEWNIKYPRWMTIVHLTYDELKEFPDLERSMHGVNTDPSVWHNNNRVVTWFDGNYSDYIRFNNAVCKNKTLVECYPNTPLYEYHGQYYTLFYEKFGSHSLAGCERGNYNCTPPNGI